MILLPSIGYALVKGESALLLTSEPGEYTAILNQDLSLTTYNNCNLAFSKSGRVAEIRVANRVVKVSHDVL